MISRKFGNDVEKLWDFCSWGKKKIGESVNFCARSNGNLHFVIAAD